MKMLFMMSFPFMVSAVFADFKVQFRTGDVKVKRQNTTEILRVGDKLPASATVIAGSDGRASLIDLTSGNVVMISSGKSLLLSAVTGAAVHDPSSLRQEMSKRQVNTTAAVRANQTGSPDSTIGWDEGTVAVDHSAHWKLYNSGKFEEVRAATSAAKDAEGKYLNAQAAYAISGSRDVKKIESTLQSVLASNLSIPLKSEANKTLAAIAFDRGEFDKSLLYGRRAEKTRSAADMDAVLYYILIISARMNGDDVAANASLADMRKYHPNSPLLNKAEEK